MSIYSIARRTTNVTTSNAAIELIAGATRCLVLECGIFLAAATASTFGIGRPAAAGVTPTSPVVLQAEDPAFAAPLVATALAWGTSPTDPTQFFRRIALPATIGTGVIWTFPKGIILAANATLVVQNIGATGVADIYFVVDE